MDIILTPNDQRVLCQYLKQYTARDGVTAYDDLANIADSPLTVGFKPASGEIRLSKYEFDIFAQKIKQIVLASEQDDHW